MSIVIHFILVFFSVFHVVALQFASFVLLMNGEVSGHNCYMLGLEMKLISLKGCC